MAICKTCGKKYSKWVTPVSARGICADCFESELNDEREVTPEQDLSALEMVPTEKPKTRIRVTSFIPRSRSKIVFVLAMSCYCVTLSYLVVAWARLAHIQGPPRAWYLSGGTADMLERWPALNHAVAVNRLLGFESRVAMTNRKDHGPSARDNEQVYRFFEWWLKRPAAE